MEARLFETKSHAEVYHKYRVIPPDDLIERILQYLREKYSGPLELAVDVGCGSGQNTFLLAKHFKKVIGSDVSQSQIEFAQASKKPEHGNISFEVGPAEVINADDGSVQLIAASQAFHWFNFEQFFNEGIRVLCPGGVMALQGYIFLKLIWERNPTKSDAITTVFNKMWKENPLNDLWAWQNREILFSKYKDVIMPYDDVVRELDVAEQDRLGTLADAAGEIKTWSAYQKYCEANGQKAGIQLIDEFKNRIVEILGDDLSESEKEIPDVIPLRMKTPFFLLMGRKPLQNSNGKAQ